MAHHENLEFFKELFKALDHWIYSENFLGIVDLGSLDINGGPHKILKKVRYVGVDLAPGPNVHLASPIELLDLPSLSFSMAISSEMLEHNPFWRESLFQLFRLTTQGGIVAWTCAGIGRPEHGTTRSDGGAAAPFVTGMGREYYQNISALDASKGINHELWFDKWAFFENFESRDTYFIGLRKGQLLPSKNLNEVFAGLIETFSERYHTGPSMRSFFHTRKMFRMVEMCLKMTKFRRYSLYYLFLLLKFYERNKFRKMVNQVLRLRKNL